MFILIEISSGGRHSIEITRVYVMCRTISSSKFSFIVGVVTLLFLGGMLGQGVSASRPGEDATGTGTKSSFLGGIIQLLLLRDLPKIEVYVVPAISDDLIYPNHPAPAGTTGTGLVMSAARGERLTASVVLRTEVAEIKKRGVTATEGTFSASQFTIRMVKSWYQNDSVNYQPDSNRVLIPELLLRDESLMRAENGENSLKTPSGNFVDISQVKEESLIKDPPFMDSATLQPFTLPANTNKQLWLDIHVPDETIPGQYTGTMVVSTGSSELARIPVSLTVLPFTLDQPRITYFLYSDSRYSPDTQEGAYLRSRQALSGEFTNFLHHQTSPDITQEIDNEPLFREYLQIRKESGLPTNEPILVQNGYNLWFDEENPDRAAELQKYQDKVAAILRIARGEGYTGELYVYAKDEPTPEELHNQADIWARAHQAGARVYCALSREGVSEEDIQSVASLLDLAIVSYQPDPALAHEFHSHGHKIGCYANPQAGRVTPETYRRNYGLRLWQTGYDVGTTWAYQGHTGTTWNVFDYELREDNGQPFGLDEVFTYPANDGAVDTIQWAGWSEAVTDARYLATLENTIAATGKNTTAVQAYLDIMAVS